MEKDEERIKAQLTRVIDALAKPMPDRSRVSADLWRFAKAHDRRNYQLIRFAMAAVSDYRTVTKAIKELAKRIHSGNTTGLLDTLTPFLYRCSSLIFNRSHIPAIIQLSRTDEKNLANTAHEMLKEISSLNPEVLEAQVQDMCKDLEAQAPNAKSTEDGGAEEILKACSGFAKKLPSKLPKERRFLLALTNYALYSSSPRAAKHAVSIIMAVADKKEMYAKDMIHKSVKDWKYGSNHFLTRLATISQLNLLAPREADEESDATISIAIKQILQINRSPQPSSGYSWSDGVDEETVAKEWALRIIANRLRAKGGSDNVDDFRAHAEPVYSTLNKLVAAEGEISEKHDTPEAQKSRLRLLAAKLLVKLCASRSVCDQLFAPSDFNSLALVAQDPLLAVRSSFIGLLKKKLVQNSDLSIRWYTIPFLLAFEPSVSLKESTLTWLRSRASFFSRQVLVNGRKNEPHSVMESIFSRLLSTLAYHPDYPPSNTDEATQVGDLADFSRYILFYLSAVANENNLSLIFHIAQRVKQARDGITKSDELTTRLHTLSDLSQATIRRFADIYSQQHKFGGGSGVNILQTYPGKMRLPNSLFALMSGHQEAQDVAQKSFLPEDIDDILDRIVRSWMKPKTASHTSNQAKKRKSEHSLDANGDTHASKKTKKRKEQTLPIRKSSGGRNVKSPNRRKSRNDEDGWESDGGTNGRSVGKTSSDRRRSNRGFGKEVNYIDRDSEDDDLEMEQWDDHNGSENGGDHGESDEEDQEQEGDQESEDELDGSDEMEDVAAVRSISPQTESDSRQKRLSSSPAMEKSKEILSSNPKRKYDPEEKEGKIDVTPTRRSTRRR
jgi:sister chromatid cohesion protein PDS5